MVVQDIFLTATAELADVVLPAAAAWAESEGTVTNSERRVQRVRKALDPPGEARDDLQIIYDLARRMGQDWGPADAESAWNELRTLSPVHAGMSYARLEAEGGLQWPCYDETHPGELFLHSRLWEDPVPGQPRAVRAGRARPAGRQARRRLPDPADHRSPARLVQHGRPDRAATPRRCGAASRSTSRPRTPRRTGWSRASGSASCLGGGRSRYPCGSTPRFARASRS